MSENKIELKSVGELLEMKFFIPSYQRGYRWTEQQVKDLLNDIDEFRPRETSCGKETWYCLQPLVVKKMDENDKRLNDEENKTYWYEVIDGQQRLTTIFIIFNVLNKQSLSIKYQTRSNSKKYLMDIAKKTDETNIDFFFMGKAKEVVNNWRGDTSALVNKLENYC
ncbi:MAG: DUF262 domain-containing protein, partial [Salinivirgaceae bacterium]|nr:DUF262 domain-containing protein [Salinivirgaceae bacterium]